MVKNLDELKDEIEKYLQKEGFAIFYGMDMSPKAAPDVSWISDENDWKDFLAVAKNEGVKTVILDIAKESEGSINQHLKDELLAASEEERKQVRDQQERMIFSQVSGQRCSPALSLDKRWCKLPLYSYSRLVGRAE
jgi:hypothetical protein